MTLSEKITSLRKKSGETQSELAEKLGISNRTVSKWENAESEPEIALLIALADHYGITVDTLIGHEKAKSESIYDDLTKAEAVQVYFRKIVDDTREMTVEFMKNNENSTHAKPVVLPSLYNGRESGVADKHIFTRIINGNDVKLMFALTANDENYRWLDDDADELARFFALLGDPRAIKLIRLLHIQDVLETFTAEYAEEMSGYPADKVSELLDIIETNGSYDAELEEGVRRIYRFCGNGELLAIMNIAKEILNKDWYGNYIINGIYKPIMKEENA